MRLSCLKLVNGMGLCGAPDHSRNKRRGRESNPCDSALGITGLKTSVLGGSAVLREGYTASAVCPFLLLLVASSVSAQVPFRVCVCPQTRIFRVCVCPQTRIRSPGSMLHPLFQRKCLLNSWRFLWKISISMENLIRIQMTFSASASRTVPYL